MVLKGKENCIHCICFHDRTFSEVFCEEKFSCFYKKIAEKIFFFFTLKNSRVMNIGKFFFYLIIMLFHNTFVSLFLFPSILPLVVTIFFHSLLHREIIWSDFELLPDIFFFFQFSGLSTEFSGLFFFFFFFIATAVSDHSYNSVFIYFFVLCSVSLISCHHPML